MNNMAIDQEDASSPHGCDGEGISLGIWLSLECWLALSMLVRL